MWSLYFLDKIDEMLHMANTLNKLKETIEKKKDLLNNIIHLMGKTYKEKDNTVKELNEKLDRLFTK